MTEMASDRTFESAMERLGKIRSKGLGARGQDVGTAKFRDGEVRALRRAVIWKGQQDPDQASITVSEAAAEYGVCLSTIYNILHKKTYADVED